MNPSRFNLSAAWYRLLGSLSLGVVVVLCVLLFPGGASAADQAGDYNVSVKALLTPDYVYTKTTDAPDLNLAIKVNKKVVYSAAETDGYKTLDDASWIARFFWKPGDQVEIVIMDKDTFSSDTIVKLKWEASNTMPLRGTADLAKILGFTATGCSIKFEGSRIENKPHIPCSDELGMAAAQELANQCRNVSPATNPPCQPSANCSDIRDEIKRGCAYLGWEAAQTPAYCAAYR